MNLEAATFKIHSRPNCFTHPKLAHSSLDRDGLSQKATEKINLLLAQNAGAMRNDEADETCLELIFIALQLLQNGFQSSALEDMIIQPKVD